MTQHELLADALERAIAAMPPQVVIVKHPHMLQGKAWKFTDGGTVYYFVHPDDIAALPTAPPPKSFYGIELTGIPVKDFTDPDMREVFIRGLDRMAKSLEPLAELPRGWPGRSGTTPSAG